MYLLGSFPKEDSSFQRLMDYPVSRTLEGYFKMLL